MADKEKSKKRLISELQRRKNNYIVTYKKIKRLVESSAGQKTIDDAIKERFRLVTLESNKAHKELREFLLPFFSETAIKEVFPEETYVEENEGLKRSVEELQQNKHDLDKLIEELSDKCRALNEKLSETEKLQETVNTLQKQLNDINHNISTDDTPHKLTRKHSDHRSEQQDMLIRDLEHRLSFRQKGQQNGNRRDRYIEQSLEKIYKINEDLADFAVIIKEAHIKSDGNFLHLKELVTESLIQLEDIASKGHVVIRSERAVVIKRAQGLLEMLNSKCS